MFTRLFWKDTFERLVATLAQVLIAVLTVDGFDLWQADWKATVTALVVAGAAVVLKSLIAAKAVDDTVSPASFVSDDRGF